MYAFVKIQCLVYEVIAKSSNGMETQSGKANTTFQMITKVLK